MKLKLMIKSIGLLFLLFSLDFSSADHEKDNHSYTVSKDQWADWMNQPSNTHKKQKPHTPEESYLAFLAKEMRNYKEHSTTQTEPGRYKRSAFSDISNLMKLPEKFEFKIGYTPKDPRVIYPHCYRKTKSHSYEQLRAQDPLIPQKWWQFYIIHPWSFDKDFNPNCYRNNEKTYCEQFKKEGVFSENINCDSLIKTLTNKDYQKPCDDPNIVKDLNYCDVMKSSLSSTKFANLECKSDNCVSLKSKLTLLKEAFKHNYCYHINNNSKNLCKDLLKEFKYAKSTHDNFCIESVTGLMDEDYETDCSFLRNHDDDMYETICGSCFYEVCFSLWEKFPFNATDSPPDAYHKCVKIQLPKIITMEDIKSEIPFSVSYFLRMYFWDSYGYLANPNRRTAHESFRENFLFLDPPYHFSEANNLLSSK